MGSPASRITDMHVCPMVTAIVPHVGGPILPPGGITVLIGGLPAARVPRNCEWDNQGMVWIELAGAVNVRDVGGLPTVDGGETVDRRVLRSENLQELTAEDIVTLVDEIGVTTIVDLRSTRELMTEGPAPLDSVDGVQHAHHPVLKEFLDASDTVAAALLLTAQQEDAERYPDDLMCGHYLGYLENRPEEVVGALRSIVAAPGAAVVHCAAGKDRTGVVIALALTTAGVDPEVIVADYVATNDRIEATVVGWRTPSQNQR